MSGHNEHITHYSAADIRRYVQGKMSALEMHAIEKAALDDPFLSDAIDGMQQALHEHEETLVTGQLQELQQQLANRTTDTSKNTGRVITLRWWKIAAAAVILVIGGIWMYTLTRPNPNNESSLAQVVAKKEEVKPEEKATATVPSQNKITAADSTVVESVNGYTKADQGNASANHGYASTNHEIILNKERKPVAKALAYNPAPAKAAASLAPQTDSSHYFGYATTAQPVSEAKVKEEQATALSAKAQKNDADMATRDREMELITIPKKDSPGKVTSAVYNNNLSGVVKGQVIDENNNPIANAYVQLPNYNNNYTTDKAGYFKIPVSDTAVDVSVNVAGYNQQNFRLQSNAYMNRLQLKPAIASSARYDTERRMTLAKKATETRKVYPNTLAQHDAEPENGWLSYDQYLEKNKKVPVSNPGLTGDVVVSFEVNNKDSLSNFKIEQSLAKPYDDEAIRLIKQGPSFKLLKGHKARVTVIVRF